MLVRMRVVIISGLSGSGKSIALHILEDASYYCVDNLPSQMLQQLVDHLGQRGYDKVAVAIDIHLRQVVAGALHLCMGCEWQCTGKQREQQKGDGGI